MLKIVKIIFNLKIQIKKIIKILKKIKIIINNNKINSNQYKLI